MEGSGVGLEQMEELKDRRRRGDGGLLLLMQILRFLASLLSALDEEEDAEG